MSRMTVAGSHLLLTFYMLCVFKLFMYIVTLGSVDVKLDSNNVTYHVNYITFIRDHLSLFIFLILLGNNMDTLIVTLPHLLIYNSRHIKR